MKEILWHFMFRAWSDSSQTKNCLTAFKDVLPEYQFQTTPQGFQMLQSLYSGNMAKSTKTYFDCTVLTHMQIKLLY